MKKCPKCGAVLDDSKVKCYMCGTDLGRQNLTNFGDTFNETIGAGVTNSPGNVFSQNNQIQNPGSTGGREVNQTFFSAGNESTSIYNNQLNNLNSMAYDERTALEKMFSSDDRFKSKSEINAEFAMKRNMKRNSFVDSFSSGLGENKSKAKQQKAQNKQSVNNGMPRQPMPVKKKESLLGKMFGKKNKAPKVAPNAQMARQPALVAQPVQQQIQPKPVPVQQKAPINWGNNLGASQQKGSSNQINKSLIFNIIALCISIAGALFVYFHFVKNNDNDKVLSLGQLKYKINNNFTMKDEKSNYHYHAFGEYCSISLTYGSTNTPDDYIENEIAKLKQAGDDGNKYVLKIDQFTDSSNNAWKQVSVVNFSADAANANGFTTRTKIKYAFIIFDGDYYTIAYQNVNDDTLCSASYQSFISSLEFKR